MQYQIYCSMYKLTQFKNAIFMDFEFQSLCFHMSELLAPNKFDGDPNRIGTKTLKYLYNK